MLLDKRYKIEKIIKSGGMGTVYLAKDLAVEEKLCAIKEMKDRFVDKGARQLAINRFLSEIHTLCSLSHPNIPMITDHFIEKNSFYFVMEFIDGTDLASFLRKNGTPGLPEENVVGWSCQVLDALIYLHSLNPPVIHRDIKPSNLILRHEDNRILLIDFGIARITNPGEGAWFGTPGYAAEEQQRGCPVPASDIFSLGATMFELLTGVKAVNFDYTSFKNNQNISETSRKIILNALALNIKDRIKNAAQMKEDITSGVGLLYDGEMALESHNFNEALLKLRNRVIEPILNKYIKHYSNECLTKWLPKNIDYFTFSLSCPPVFELIIKKNESKKKLEFYKKIGILDKVAIGEVTPEGDNVELITERILQKFIEDYEDFKSGG